MKPPVPKKHSIAPPKVPAKAPPKPLGKAKGKKTTLKPTMTQIKALARTALATKASLIMEAEDHFGAATSSAVKAIQAAGPRLGKQVAAALQQIQKRDETRY